MYNSNIIKGINTLSKSGTLKTENDKDITNLLSLYIISYDKISTKKDAFKIDQKLISDEDSDLINFEEILEEIDKETILIEEKNENLDKKLFSNESINICQKFEFLLQIDIFYNNLILSLEENNNNTDKIIENWFDLTKNYNEIINLEIVKFYLI